MTGHVLLLAQAEASAGPMDVVDRVSSRLDILNHPDELLTALANLHVVWASVLLVVGGLCILNGYRWHRYVVVVCAFLGGLGLGHLLSKQMGESRIAMGAIGLLCAVIATPLVRFAVAIFGGLTGAFIGAHAWTGFNGAEGGQVAAAGMGFIAVGMAAFLMYRVVVMLFTSFGGAAMAVIGGITLMLQVPSWQEPVRTSLSANHLLVPLLVSVGAVTGLVLQNTRMQGRSGGSQAKAA
jgi:hypothetical protein